MATKIVLSNPTIPLGSTILVTGANGLIASHVVDQLLAAGYKVRGTVRNPQRDAWLKPLFEKRHGEGNFEMIQVSEFEKPDVWDAAVKGVAGIAHVAGGAKVTITDVEEVLAEELAMSRPLLEVARKESSVKSFVSIASAWGASTPNASKKDKITEWTWNEEAIALAASDKSDKEKGWAPFMAVRTRLEQELWKWVDSEKPPYTFNTILLATVIGECLDPVHQGIPSTAGMVHWVWSGDLRNMLGMMPPQWHVDSRDSGKLFVAALTTPGVNHERIFGFADRYSWHQVAEILRKLAPNKEIAPVEFGGVDQREVPNQRGAELLRIVGQEKGWTSLEGSIRENLESILVLEKDNARGDRLAKS